MYEKADMAQLVEQRIRNAWVPGSSPGIGSISGVSISGISTSVVHGLPKPGRRVRFPYSAPLIIRKLRLFTLFFFPLSLITKNITYTLENHHGASTVQVKTGIYLTLIAFYNRSYCALSPF